MLNNDVIRMKQAHKHYLRQRYMLTMYYELLNATAYQNQASIRSRIGKQLNVCKQAKKMLKREADNLRLTLAA